MKKLLLLFVLLPSLAAAQGMVNPAAPAVKVSVKPICDSSGSPGNATCNLWAGRAAISAGLGFLTINNSLVSASSVVIATAETNDSTCSAVRSVVPAAGSFQIFMAGAACTAITKVSWVIVSR